MRRALAFLLAAALVAAVVIGLSQATKGRPDAPEPYDLQAGLKQLEGAPPRLAALHRQAGDLLGGGQPALEKRLRALRGTPVVVNVWASWCGPCRLEFPLFARAGTRWGKKVAFLGVATRDARGPAARFLGESPVPYPSYLDSKGQPLVRALGLPAGPVPLTAFIGRDGRSAYTGAGSYATEAELDEDIRRYLRP